MVNVLVFQEPRVAFEGIGATELYPCVLFYSNVFGGKVTTEVVSLCCLLTSFGFLFSWLLLGPHYLLKLGITQNYILGSHSTYELK